MEKKPLSRWELLFPLVHQPSERWMLAFYFALYLNSIGWNPFQ
jgi:hypothetical protein